MSNVNIGNLFNFSRSLPTPFSARRVGVASKYSSSSESTLSSSVIKGINAVCNCKTRAIEGAVGELDGKFLAEYKSAAGADAFHLVVYDSRNGNLMACVYDRNTEVSEKYLCHSSGRDGAAIFMALFPKLMEDAEFSEYFENYYNEFTAGFPDVNKAQNYAAYLCDNAYRRIKEETCPAYVKVNIDRSGNIMQLTNSALDSGSFTPKSVLVGEFTIFAKMAKSTTIEKAETIIEHEDFIGKFLLNERKLSKSEKQLVPKLPAWYVIPEEVVDICKHAQATTGRPSQMRNFLMRGPAGTGKTMGARAIAAGLGLPYMKYTCSASTEIFDFIGQIFPDSNKADKTTVKPKDSGKLSYACVAAAAKLPDLADMEYDPSGVYKKLTGEENLDATTQECMALVMDRILDQAKTMMPTDSSDVVRGQSFSYVETDFIKALKYGYVVEIQEPTTIMQPGVLVGLNSLLEQEGSITLPTGEIIERHPDAVVIVTTNVSYEGCRGMNQSIIDRMNLVRDIELPSPEIMVQRAMSVTGEEDELKVSKMVQVVIDMSKYCRNNSISDGNVGMRSLIDWIISSNITGDVYQSALNTVISKATADEEDREALITTVLEPIFAPTRRKIAI